MAMTGARTVTANIAEEEKSPPRAIVEKHAPADVRRWREHHREAITELLHWTYGAAGGVVFGLLPARLRGLPAVGPAYGLVIWLGFELAIAPILGVRHARQRRVLWRAALALDHILYGLVVAGRLAPEPEVIKTAGKRGDRGRTASVSDERRRERVRVSPRPRCFRRRPGPGRDGRPWPGPPARMEPPWPGGSREPR